MRRLDRSGLLVLVLALVLQLVPAGPAQASVGEIHAVPLEARVDAPDLAASAWSSVPDLAVKQDGSSGSARVNGPPVREVEVSRGGQTFKTVTYQSEIGPDGREVGAGSVLVKFKPVAVQAARSDAHRAAGALAVERIGVADIERVQVAPGGVSAALAAYRQ